MEKKTEEPGLLLNEVFANYSYHPTAFGFIEGAFKFHRAARRLVRIFGDPGTARTWLLATFYDAWARTHGGKVVLKESFGSTVPKDAEKIVVTTDAAGFLLTHPEFPEVHPEVRDISKHVDPVEIREVIRHLAEPLAVSARGEQLFDLLTDDKSLDALVRDMLRIAPPFVGLSRSPGSQEMLAPDPPLPAGRASLTSTAGVLAKASNGALVITTAYHGTGPTGTSIVVGGCSTVVLAHHEELDVAIAAYRPHSDEPNRSFPVMANAPGPGVPMYFSGMASKGIKKTHVDAVDPAIVHPEPGEKVRIYTRNDNEYGELNQGDSGCALISGDGHVAGFAWARTPRGAGLRYSKWIWAKSVFDYLDLHPL